MIRVHPLPFFLVLILTACSQSAGSTSQTELTVFMTGAASGIIDNSEIDEASGLVASRANPGKFWTHNDSGDKARIFLISNTGHYLATVVLQGITNRDWEDIALGPGPEEGKNYLYIADIGDNLARHDVKYLYRIEEPVIFSSTKDTVITNIQTISFRLEDGPQDSEALVIDPRGGDAYIFSKREPQIGMYLLKTDSAENKVAKRVLTLPYTQVVAADESPREGFLLKTYDSVYYWKNPKQLPFAELLRTRPESEPYAPEPQGEAIAFAIDGTGYYTLSEKSGFDRPVLYFYKKRKGP